MNLWKDLAHLIRGRPLRCICRCLVGGTLGVAIGFALLHSQQTSADLRSLLQAWPLDQTTLQLKPSITWPDYLRLTHQLPKGEWTAFRTEGSITWVDGSLTADFRDQDGRTLLPGALQQGTPYGLSSRLSAGETLTHQQTSYQIIGEATGSAPSPHVLPLRAAEAPLRSPTLVRVRRPASALRARLHLSLNDQHLTLIDHQNQRAPIESQLRRLRLRTTGSLVLAGLLAALVLLTLLTSDYVERRGELALRRLLGATPGDIHRQLLTETLVLTGGPLLTGLMLFYASLSVASLTLALSLSLALLLLLAAIPTAHAVNRPPAHGLQLPG